MCVLFSAPLTKKKEHFHAIYVIFIVVRTLLYFFKQVML
jgi:hypothetical protein